MKRSKTSLIIWLCVCFCIGLVLTGCNTVFKPDEEWVEVKANPATVTLSKQSSTTITVRIFDAGSDMGYKVEFSTADGGYFSEDEIHLFGQSSCTTQFYPYNITGGDVQKVVAIRVRVVNLQNRKEYTGEVRITVYQ